MARPWRYQNENPNDGISQELGWSYVKGPWEPLEGKESLFLEGIKKDFIGEGHRHKS